MDRFKLREYVVSIGIFFLLVSIVYILNYNIHYIVDNANNNACIDLGLETYKSIGYFDFCADQLDNLYYVNIDCKGFLWNRNCTAKGISIYDVNTLTQLAK